MLAVSVVAAAGAVVPARAADVPVSNTRRWGCVANGTLKLGVCVNNPLPGRR